MYHLLSSDRPFGIPLVLILQLRLPCFLPGNLKLHEHISNQINTVHVHGENQQPSNLPELILGFLGFFVRQIT